MTLNQPAPLFQPATWPAAAMRSLSKRGELDVRVQDLPRARVLELMRCGQMDSHGLLPWSSNYTFLVSLGDRHNTLLGVYKPRKGERPLWDFPRGTLCKREAAAFLISDALGWDLVPPTVLRDGVMGLGSVQLFIDCDPNASYFSIRESHQADCKKLALFDAVANNADRKGGHCLLGKDGRLWAIDHGITFNSDPKLRTVIWDWAGEPIPDAELEDLMALQDKLIPGQPLALQMSELLLRDEMDALRYRIEELIDEGRFPAPGYDGPNVPWPLI